MYDDCMKHWHLGAVIFEKSREYKKIYTTKQMIPIHGYKLRHRLLKKVKERR